MRGNVELQTDFNQEIPAGTTIRDGFDSYTLEQDTKTKRGLLARLFPWWPLQKARAVAPAIREDRLIRYEHEGII